jgi:hypothetical protein
MTGERNGFSKLEALMEFLKNDMDHSSPSVEEENGSDDSNP